MEIKSCHLMWIYLVNFLLIISSIHLYAQQENGWKWQYPKPQGNSINDIFVFSKDTICAVGDIGTFMKTTDGGKTWKVKHHIGNTYYNLAGIHFIDKNNGWAAGGIVYNEKNVLLKTTDGGDSWNEVSVGTKLPLLSVYFADKDTGVVVGEDGIVLRTTDGGNSWDIKKMDIYISQDRGRNLYLDIFSLYKVTFTDLNNGWVIGFGYYGNQIYRTTDCGRTWKWTDSTISTRLWGAFFDISFVGKNNVYIVGDNGVFINSTDGGLSWKYQNLSEKYNNTNYQYFYSITFTDSLNGWIVGGSYYSIILKTTDGGESWKEIDSAKNLGQLYRIRFSDSNNAFIMGQFGSLYRTTDTGNSWDKSQGNKDSFLDIHFSDENTGWAVGDSGIIINTTDGGSNWIKQSFNPQIRLWSVYASDKSNAFAVGGSYSAGGDDDKKSVLMYTTDGGTSWLACQDLPKTYWFKSIKFMNDSTGWITGTEGILLKTTDKGKSWAKATFTINKSLDKIQFVNDSTGWISYSSDGKLLKTADKGKTWNEQIVDSTFWLRTFYFVNESKGWTAGEYKGKTNILRTIDGGNNWIPCSNVPIANYYSIYFYDENNGWAGGYDYLNNKSVIIRTTDGGNTWSDQNCPLKNDSWNISLFFLNSSTAWAVGNGIAKTTNGGDIVSVERDNNEHNTLIPSNMDLMQNYPNPFNPSTMIQYKISKSGFVSLKVYDLLGRQITTLVDQYQKEGEYKVKWSAENLPSGIYIYEIRTNNFTKSGKMLLLK